MIFYLNLIMSEYDNDCTTNDCTTNNCITNDCITIDCTTYDCTIKVCTTNDNKKIESIFAKDFKKYLITEDKIIKEYPSVSSVTKLINEYFINKWRTSIGAEKANELCKVATERGTQVHAIIEAYLKSDKKIKPSLDNVNYSMFIKMSV